MSASAEIGSLSQETIDIAIVGAGAAGLMAAIFAGRTARQAGRELKIVAFDGAEKLGAKILIAGGGRCNVTHDIVLPEDFNGGNRNLVARILRSFPVDETIRFFSDLGVTLKREEGGKLFPTTNRARTVLEALLSACEDAGADLFPSSRVTAVLPDGAGFAIEAGGRQWHAGSVVLATGGKSIPKSGSDGFGYELARQMGHTTHRTTPALVPLLLPPGHPLTQLSGISLLSELMVVLQSGRIVQRETGSLLFTHFGLSGPVALDMSRHWISHSLLGPVQLVANLVPGTSREETLQWLSAESQVRPRATVQNVVATRLPGRLAELILQLADVGPVVTIGQLQRAKRHDLATQMTALNLPVVGDRGYGFAEVTAGGVPIDEISTATMESKTTRGLYLCGEILDVDGKIGGYNFQWAWATGRLAGISAGSRRIEDLHQNREVPPVPPSAG